MIDDFFEDVEKLYFQVDMELLDDVKMTNQDKNLSSLG